MTPTLNGLRRIAEIEFGHLVVDSADLLTGFREFMSFVETTLAGG